MAIEPVKRLTIISPITSGKRLLRILGRLGAVDIIDAKEQLKDEEGRLKPQAVSTEEPDERLHKIDFILNLFNAHAPKEQSFFEGIAPVPQVVGQEEIFEAVKTYDLEGRYREANDLDEVLRRSDRTRTEIVNKLQDLEPLSALPFRVSDFYGVKKVRLFVGSIPSERLELIDDSRESFHRFVWEKIQPTTQPSDQDYHITQGAKQSQTPNGTIKILCACLPDEYDDVHEALTDIDFEEIQLPRVTGLVSEHILEQKGVLSELEIQISKTIEKIKVMARERRTLVTLKAFWQASRNQKIAAGKTLQGKWVHILTGYILAKDIALFEQVMKKELPECQISLEDPAPGEDVPVSLSVPYAFRPLSLLVEMFGLPDYRAFDPTPFLNFNFYLFFGICFSDVGYGTMLVALASYLVKKTKPYEGINNFARILLYSGVSTIIFGALLGSWFGDLYLQKYLGENNPLLWLQSKFVVLDPMNKTIVALLIALFIGVLNQFYGISLKMYGALKDGDWKTAVFDGLFWLILLPGLLIMVSKLFVDTPPHIFTIGLWFFGSAALGLVLTQGRDLKNPVAKILHGLVSLYGIMGSYGVTAFIGDTLSYCRLLALGLTTSIVGMTFNMLAGILREVPVVGFVLFIIIIVVGHMFNFAISLLGAFVHSMRLVFVEFFGRFYEGGARPFQPLGFDSPLCILRKTPEGK